jgi:hypothetical protein
LGYFKRLRHRTKLKLAVVVVLIAETDSPTTEDAIDPAQNRLLASGVTIDAWWLGRGASKCDSCRMKSFR